MTLLHKLESKQLIRPPSFVPDNLAYLVIMGSMAYGVAGEASDWDIYGFAIPPKDYIFPHLAGHIPGLNFTDDHPKAFDVWQQHHVNDPSADGGKGREYDFSIYSITRYFQLAVVENNPNMVDSLFVPHTCVLHATQVANRLREERRSLLHKRCWHTYKGYAFSQLHKAFSKEHKGKRKDNVDKYGYDLKFAYHVVRLLNEVEQIMIEGDLDLQRNREQLKSIRRGEWTEEQIRDYFSEKERSLEEVYNKSLLPHGPDPQRVKRLFMECLEMHYGSISDAVKFVGEERKILTEIARMVKPFQ